MLGKVVGAAAVAAGVMAMAMPAGAVTAAQTMSAKFETTAPSGATVVIRPHAYKSHVRVVGLAPGKYDFTIGIWEDSNHDGVPDGGTSAHQCNFQVGPGHKIGACEGGGRSLLSSWDAPNAPDLYTAIVTRLGGGTGVQVLSATLS